MPKKITEEESPQRFFSFFGFVSVYREELDEINNLWQPHGNISIKSGGYEFENLDELNEYFGNNTPDLSISVVAKQDEVFDPDFSVGVDFNKRSSVMLSSYKEEGRLYFETKEILSKNHSYLKFIFHPAHIFQALCVIGLFYTFDFISDQLFSPAFTLLGFILVVVLYVPFAYYFLRLFPEVHWSIDLNTKHAPNFVKRNKDKIIWAIVGGFLYWLLPKLYNQITQFFTGQ